MSYCRDNIIIPNMQGNLKYYFVFVTKTVSTSLKWRAI